VGFFTGIFKNPGHERSGYPFDYDASLRYTRPKTGLDYFPEPSNYSAFQKAGLYMNGGMGVSGLFAEQDPLVWAQGYGKDPFGPIVSAYPDLANNQGFATSASFWTQVMIPGLSKQDAP